jgi:hypothetical protein
MHGRLSQGRLDLQRTLSFCRMAQQAMGIGRKQQLAIVMGFMGTAMGMVVA